MVTPLGLRYPKVTEIGQTEVTAGVDIWWLHIDRVSSTAFAVMANNDGLIPIAPFRYSEVRKVVFYATFRKNTGASYPVRMRIAIASSQALSRVTQVVTIAPGQYRRLSGAAAQSSIPISSFNPSHLFDAIGSSSSGNLPVTNDAQLGDVELLQITFDRFVAEDDDFFTVWDAVNSDNDYIFFKIVAERTDGSTFVGSGAELEAANIGVSIVQAPAGVNKTCTLFPVTPGFASASQMTTTFTGAGISSIGRPFHFRYDASKWDNITSITFLGYVRWSTANARSWAQGLHRLDTNEPVTVTLLDSETIGDALATPGSSDVGIWRGSDLLSSITDGETLCMLFDNLGATTAQPFGWLEIIQNGFTKTTCPHPVSFGVPLDLNVTTGSNTGIPAQSLFDPTWYQGFPDDLILDRKLYIAFFHTDNVSNTEIGIFIDQDLSSNISDLAVTAPTLVGLTPTCTSTPQATDGRKFRFDVPAVDPIDLAGQRKLVYGIIIQSITSGNADTPGDSGLLYSLSVPNQEFLPVGDVFATGSFDSEGCAATSAGLGDPGKLVISNGQTIPKKFDPDQGNITNNGMPVPFPDEIPVYETFDTSASPEGGMTDGTYFYKYTIRDCCTGAESDPSDVIEVQLIGASPAGKVVFSFAGVRVPSDNLCEICMYRSVAGGSQEVMAKVGCFNPDDTETFEDDTPDDLLDFDDEPLSNLNAPMPCVPYIVAFRNRIFGAGDIPIHDPAGTVDVVNGSDIVVGSDDVEWDRCLEGKYIMFGDCTRYEIDRVLPPELGISPPISRLKLSRPFEGVTNTGLTYEICGHPNRLYFSEPLEPEYWPVVNFIDVEPGDGDRIMGLATNFDRLLIYKRRKTFVLTFGDTPLEVNVPARISSDVGMVAPRSPAQIENGTVALAERGLQLFDGRGVAHVPESGLANDIFTDPDNPRYVRRDDLSRVMDAVGVFYPKREQYLLLLPTVQTNRGCNLMMCWDTKLRNITLFEFCQQFQSMVVGKDTDGDETVYLGDVNGFVWAFDIGNNDGVGVPGDTGTVRGTLTGGGTDDLGRPFFEDENATFIEGGLAAAGAFSGLPGFSGSLDGGGLGLAGVCVSFRAPGETVWQTNIIFGADSTKLYLATAFTFDPTGYEYMLGAINFEAVFKPFNYGSDDYTKRLWKHKLIHEVEQFHSLLQIELKADFSNDDQFQGDIINEDGILGRNFYMDTQPGKQVRQVERIVHTYIQIRMSNFAPEEPIRIINHVLQGTPQESR